MISITTLAADKVKEISKSEGAGRPRATPPGRGRWVRRLSSTICTSKTSRLIWTSSSSDGGKAVRRSAQLPYLDGREIDYVEGSHAPGSSSATRTCPALRLALVVPSLISVLGLVCLVVLRESARSDRSGQFQVKLASTEIHGQPSERA